MKTKTLLLAKSLSLIFICFATFSLFSQIEFEGLYVENEGSIGWHADGSGPEPTGTGHQVPFPGFSKQYFYGASCDYDYINPNPNASLGHFLSVTGFPSLETTLIENNIDINLIKLKMGLSSLKHDSEGVDWMVLGDYHYNNYYDGIISIYFEDQLMITMDYSYANSKIHKDVFTWFCETNFITPVNASGSSSELAQIIAGAFMKDVNGESVQMTFEMESTGIYFDGNGRDGRFFNLSNGKLHRGTPELPFKGQLADNEGFAGWDADGTGPEPKGDGHQTQVYYGASVDYDDINDNENAALGHFINGSKGFRNLLLQLEYRGYTIEDLQLDMGLISMGNDKSGEDWGIGWSNYYNQIVTCKVGGEAILQMMSDTLLLRSGWSSESTFSPVVNVSIGASEGAKKVAKAFLMDLGQHQIAMITPDISGGTETFNGNGRSGALWEINEAKVIGKCGQVQCIEPGPISGTLLASEKPYLINGHMIVHDSAILIIEPGAKLAFRGPYHITANGNIKAMGTKEDPIVFTHSNPLLYWDGIDIDGYTEGNDSTIFDYCIFEYGYGFGNQAYNCGGALAVRDMDNLVIKNSIFRHNYVDKEGTYAPSGGAIGLWNSSPLIMSTVFHDNSATLGGAVFAYLGSNPIISNCLFYRNTAINDGGAIGLMDNCNAMIVNNTIVGNNANRGGAIDLYDHSLPTIINTIMWDNIAVTGNEVHLLSFSNPDFYNCDIKGGIDAFGGAYFNGEYVHCIDEDPLFIYADENDYQLLENSPCINQGLIVSIFILPEKDLAGNPRFDLHYDKLDIGAYEYYYFVDIREPLSEQNGLSVYPNPATNFVRIDFELDQSENVMIAVYNLLGEQIDLIYQGNMQTGKHTINWQAGDLTNGVYFIQMLAGVTLTTQKILKQ